MKNPTFDALRYQANALGWSVNIDKNSDDDEVSTGGASEAARCALKDSQNL